ncbi:MAG: diaminopimelate epimerase [Gammaproteobacteria bacterium]|jgi:diaminopimelate epimerase|nr:diaminopimelate epimerase [Chromatiales bacterium]MDP6435688.1 diaminopimelate epimerase [Gammaproteobacteria bacterium]MDP7041931.1 diaminopimelate epimerase [Gammaproteobacteria bacterium]
MQLPFTKMHGLGNDFVLLRSDEPPAGDTIRRLADRSTGIGFDQLLWLTDPQDDDADVFYRVFNADGGEVEQCGNGARCIVHYLAGDEADTERLWNLAYPGGVVEARVQADGAIAVNMGEPDFDPASLPFVADEQQDRYHVDVAGETVELSAVSMGNPHAVILVDDVGGAPVARLGFLLERHERFPNRANIGFMQVVSPGRIRLRVFERGVGETSACGTGACASVAVGVSLGLLSGDVTVVLPGGELEVRWAGPGSPVWLVGEAENSFEGVVEI